MEPSDRNRDMLYAHSASSMDKDIAYILSHVLITRIRMLLYGSDVSPCSRPPRTSVKSSRRLLCWFCQAC